MQVTRLDEGDVNVALVDGREPDWHKQAKQLLNDRRNFLLILPQSAEAIEAIDQLVAYAPAPLPKWQINTVQDLVATPDSLRLSDALQNNDYVFLIENLRRPSLVPPATQPFVAYCELRGIVGESDSLEKAQEICNRYSTTIKKAKARPFVRVHQWTGAAWKPVNPFGC